MMRKVVILVLLLAALLAIVPAAGARGARSAQVYVVHGIPGTDVDPSLDPRLPVDVAVNGQCALEGFVFGQIVGPLSFQPGTYDIAISLSDGNKDGQCGPTVVLQAPVPFAAGENASVVAHLTADGGITASKFTNDVSRPRFLNTRVIVHHLAEAPAVDISLQRLFAKQPRLFLEDVVNGQQAAAVIVPGNWNVSIFPANVSHPVFGANLRLNPFTTYLVYAVGSLEGGTFRLLTKAVPSFR